MTWPASDVVTTNADAGTDSPATFRTDVLDLLTKFNLLRNHVSSLGQSLLNRSTAALMRTDLGSTAVGDAVFIAATAAAGRTALAAAASGANSDITSLTALTAGGLPDNSVLTADIANANVTPAKLSQPFTSGTAVATTSGTAIDFTGIPSWAKRITVMLSGVSTSGTARPIVQLGSGSPEATGYVGAYYDGSLTSLSSGVIFSGALASNTSTVQIVFTLMGSNSWTFSGVPVLNSGTSLAYFSGVKTLAGVLDRVRITTSNGTDTFDAGSVNILYE